MAAQSKLELVIQSNSSQMISDLNKALSKLYDTDEALDKSTKKGAEGFGKLGGAVGKLAGMFTAGGAMSLAIQAFQFDLDKAFDRIEAMIRLQEHANTLARQFAGSGGGRLQNIPGTAAGTTTEEINQVFGIAQKFGLGSEGPQKLLDAYTALRSSNRNLNQDQAFASINEAAELSSLDPRTDMTGVSRALGDFQASTGMTAQQAQNFLMIAQEQGRPTDPSTAGKMTSAIVNQGRLAGISPARSAALATWTSRALQDETGEDTVTLLRTLITNLKTRSY